MMNFGFILYWFCISLIIISFMYLYLVIFLSIMTFGMIFGIIYFILVLHIYCIFWYLKKQITMNVHFINIINKFIIKPFILIIKIPFWLKIITYYEYIMLLPIELQKIISKYNSY